jgi:hypothetical protein
MAEDRKSAKNTTRRILADSSNAKHRFGFAGEHGSPITSAPKLSDLWFIEFKTVSGLAFDKGVTVDVSALAKSVSHISLMTSSQPIDQYGKRVYIPTRIDFPEVTIQMYDTVDGKMFDLSRDIYSKFFKNQDAKVTSANAEEVLTSPHLHGRKIPDGKHNYYHQHFEKITIYHFFGNLDGPKLGSSPSSLPQNAGHGTIQKIELINPLVTNLTFSSSDYSISELRTVDMTIQPENIRIEKAEKVNFPAWMSTGMDYMLDELVSLKKPGTSAYPGDLEAALDDYDTVNNFKGLSETDARNQDPFKDKWATQNNYNKNSHLSKNPNPGHMTKEMEMKGIDYEKRELQDAQDDKRKLRELMLLYKTKLDNPDDKDVAELEAALKANIGVLSAARLKKFNVSGGTSRFDEGWDFSKVTSDKNPVIPGFGDLGNSNPPMNSLPSSSDFGSSMINELVSSFFGNRSFNINNTNNSLSSLLSSSTNGGSVGREISGSKISDGIRTSTTVTKPESAVIITRLPDVKETIYTRGEESSFSPGVSKIIKYKKQ